MQVTNNYSYGQKYKNPGFGRLIIKDNVPFEIAEAALNSKGVRKLTQLFHDVGKDVVVTYERYPESLGDSFLKHYMDQPLLKVGQRILKKFGPVIGTITDESSKLKKFGAREAKTIFVNYSGDSGAEYLNRTRRNLKRFNDSLDKKPQFPPFSNILINRNRG